MAAAVLCLGMVASSCHKNNKEEKKDKADIEKLDNGDYKINGYKFVDLGLPSGLLWAECNVGASSETAQGTEFAWGETKSKDSYSAENYKYGKDAASYTKYCSADGKHTLDAEDDAATVALKEPCRTPLASEFAELLNADNTTSEWTSKTVDGKTVNGFEVTSKKNGKSIFFPAYGYSGKQGDYWCADLFESTSLPFDWELAAHRLFNEASGANGAGSLARYNSSEIRPVASVK